ncbi:MAG: hypothetical protein ABIR58_01660 [Gemmatimonadaceae bacterium]
MNAVRKLILIAFWATPALASSQDPQPVKTDSTVSVPVDTSIVVSIDTVVVDMIGMLRASSLMLVTGDAVDQLRSDQLLNGVAPGQSLLLRSASSLTPMKFSPNRGWALALIPPHLLAVVNSKIPFSQNNGSLWAGRGLSNRALLGFMFESAHARLIFAPEVIVSANGDWTLREDYYAPPVPEENSGRGYVLPYYYWTFPIDQPMRFGKEPIRKFDFGQSTALVSAFGIEAGGSNESQWWGPGMRNAIVLSNNAPGFPHLFLRTGRPIRTPIGALEVRWLVGGLTESRYFDTLSTNNLRSLASFAATVQTALDPNLTIGLARSVYARASEWNQIPGRWLHVFANTNRPQPRPEPPVQDTVLPREGHDQLISLFGRWVFPNDGFELYGEWARTQLPRSFRDLLVAPNHTQGYTLGLQWRSRASRHGFVRLQGEVTQLEQSATFRDRPIGSWYTSLPVVQGYTNQGEVIGASIGPGASTQWVAVDYLRQSWRVGAFAGRVRWNEDVHSTYGFPEYVAYCNHDVTLYPGIRTAVSSAFGTLSVDVSLQNRVNVFFQNGGGCPNNGRRLDLRNNTLSVAYSPFRWR